MDEHHFEGEAVLNSWRWRLVALALVLLAAGSLLSCREHKAAKANKAVAMSAEELQRSATQARQAIEGLKPEISALNTTLTELHRQYDPLPPGLPGFGETRAKFYAAAEGVGMMNASLPWLSNRIDSAVKAGDGAELSAIAQGITLKYDEVHQAARVISELRHEVLPFKSRLEEGQVSGKSSCE